MTPATAPLSFINARLRDGRVRTLRVAGAHIVATDVEPQPGDIVVDLAGDRILPGLINAHDHLHLNCAAASKDTKQYRDVRDWIADVNARRCSEPAFEVSVSLARDDRLLLGGMKNLLSGVTSVAHHDTLYPSLSHAEFPVSVVHRYGWSHSLYIDGEERVQRSYAQTLRAWPWIIHAAEGTTAAATAEFESLEKLGCIGPNTVLVHGIALDAGQRLRIVHARASLVWCPSSNLRLFARTAGIADLLRHGRVALGTDSRLSGGRDLLDEIRTAAGAAPLDADALEALVTRDAARLLRLRDRGNLRAGSRADLLVLPSEVSLQNVRRADIRLVMLRGRVRFGDREYAERVSPREEFSDVRLDGRSKVLDARLAARLARARFSEPGLELNQPTWQAA